MPDRWSVCGDAKGGFESVIWWMGVFPECSVAIGGGEGFDDGAHWDLG